jgi:hypothetical protein
LTLTKSHDSAVLVDEIDAAAASTLPRYDLERQRALKLERDLSLNRYTLARLSISQRLASRKATLVAHETLRKLEWDGENLELAAHATSARRRLRKYMDSTSWDAGGALGAALAAMHLFKQQRRTAYGYDGISGSLLGLSFTQAAIERRLAAAGARFAEVNDDEMIDLTAHALAASKQ